MVERRKLLAWLGLAALGTAAADEPLESADWSVTRDRARQEAGPLRRAGTAVRRDGKRLSITSRSGKVVNFDSVHPGPEAESQYTDYRYAGALLGGRFHRVNVIYYEGDSIFLVSAQSGVVTEIYEEPRLSPDRRYLFVASPSEAYNTSGIFLWEISAQGELIERLRFEPTEYALFNFRRWEDKRSISLNRIGSYAGHCTPDKTWQQAMVLQREGDSWVLHPRGAGVCKAG